MLDFPDAAESPDEVPTAIALPRETWRALAQILTRERSRLLELQTTALLGGVACADAEAVARELHAATAVIALLPSGWRPPRAHGATPTGPGRRVGAA